MTGPEQWWEPEPDERPIPPDVIGRSVEETAERIVEGERQAIIREDTEPTLQTLLSIRAQAVRKVRDPRTDRKVLRGAAALLLAGCVGAFSLGWSHGATAETKSPDPVTERTVRQQGVKSDEGSSTRTDSRSPEEVSEK